MHGSPDQLTNRIFAEAAGVYPAIGNLTEVLVKIYDRHLHEIPAGYGVKRLLDAGAKEGYIVRQPDGSLLVRSVEW